MYSLCSGGGVQQIIVVGVLSRNCVIFESTPTLTFWPKRSAIWVGVLSSEYGNTSHIALPVPRGEINVTVLIFPQQQDNFHIRSFDSATLITN